MGEQQASSNGSESVMDRFLSAQRMIETDAQQAVEKLESLQQDIATLGIFSSNEILEDVSTKTLHLLLVEPCFATALLGCPTGPGQSKLRQTRVKKAIDLFGAYLGNLERLEVLDKKSDLTDYHELLESSSNSDDEALAATAPRNAAIQRDAKIARFRAKKEVQSDHQRLLSLQQRRKRLGIEAEDELDGHDEDSLLRNLILKQLDIAAKDAIEEWHNALRELPMLKMAIQMEERRATTEKHQGNGAAAGDRRPPVSNKPLQLTHITQDATTGQLRMEREEIRSKVFQPGWTQPKYTVEQWGEIERQRALEREAKQSVSEEQRKERPRRYDELVKDGMEDRTDLVDASAAVDRAWDDWKDENPRGMGNKMGDRGDRNF